MLRAEQHASAVLERLDGSRIQRIAEHICVLAALLRPVRVNPYMVAVAESAGIEPQSQARGLLQPVQRYPYLPDILNLAVLQSRVAYDALAGEAGTVAQFPGNCLTEDFFAVVTQAQRYAKRVGVAPAVTVHNRHRNDGRIPAPEFLAFNQALAVHKRIQNPDKGASLPGVVLDVEELVAAEARGAQAVLDVGLVALECPFAAGEVEGVCLTAQAVLLQALAEYFKVVRVEHAGIFGDLAVIWVNLELAVFVAHNRGFAQGHDLAEVVRRAGPVPVEYAALVGICEREGGTRMGGESFTSSHAAADVEILALLGPFPA